MCGGFTEDKNLHLNAELLYHNAFHSQSSQMDTPSYDPVSKIELNEMFTLYLPWVKSLSKIG